MDFKRKMKMPTTIKEAAQAATDAQNKTVMHGERNSINQSPNPGHIMNNNKQDLNMTAPLHSEQQKVRKMNEVVGSPIQNVNKIRENSIDYNTIQHSTGPHKGINVQNHQQYGQGDRIAAYHRRLTSHDPTEQARFARSWSIYECRVASLREDPNVAQLCADTDFTLPFARIEALAVRTEGSLAVVTHGLVCRAIATRHLEATDPSPGRWANTSVTVADGPRPWRVRLLNCTRHLDGAEADDPAAPSGL